VQLTEKQKTYFGTTVKITVGAGLVYLLYRLFKSAFSGPGHWGSGNPWGGGGNADQGKLPTSEGSSQDAKGGGGNASPGSQGPGANKGTNTGSGWTDTKTDNANNQPSDTEYVFSDGGTPESHGYTMDAKGVYRNSAGVSIDDVNIPAGGQYDLTGKWMENIHGNYTVRKVRKYKWKGIGAFNNNRTDFITTYYTAALRAQKATGIFPETMFAQAIWESSDANGNFGQGAAAKNANNFFGIHADSSWTGDIYNSYDDGRPTAFRKYPDIESSIADYYTFLKGNSNYAPAFTATTVEDQIQDIANGGYAGSPGYADKLISLLPWIRATESTVNTGNTDYTYTATDAAVNTDMNAGNDRDNSPDLTWIDKTKLFYLEHDTAIKRGLGVAVALGVVYIAVRTVRGSNKLKYKTA